MKYAWRFAGNADMEREYQGQHLLGLTGNLKPIAYTILPFGIILRIGFVVSNILSNTNYSASEIAISVCRSCILSALIGACYFADRFKEQKVRFGMVILWGYRGTLLFLIAQEIGMQQDQSELTHSMIVLAYLFIIGPIITPTYEEHLCMLLFIASSKPAAYLLTGSLCPLSRRGCSNDLAWQSYLQRVITLCASAGVNLVSHCDRRRLWTSSPAIKHLPSDQPENADAEAETSSLNDLDSRALAAAALAAGWQPLTPAESQAWRETRSREAREMRRLAHAADTAHGPDWQCDGAVLDAGPGRAAKSFAPPTRRGTQVTLPSSIPIARFEI